MDQRTHDLDEKTLTAERAFDWLRRLNDADVREREAFIKWISRSPQNGGEVLVATTTDLVMRGLFRHKQIDVDRLIAESKSVRTIGDATPSRDEGKQRRRVRIFGFVGLGIAAATAALLIAPALVPDAPRPTEYATLIGEQREVALPDGSSIMMNTQSKVRVVLSRQGRDVYLEDGQAMFSVAKDAARPFRVHVKVAPRNVPGAGKDAVVQALGTKFDVRRRADRVDVAVVEGVVQVRASDGTGVSGAPRAARVAAGQSVSIQDSGITSPPKPVSLSEISAWQQRRLIFTDNTLAEIAEEFRRYNRTPRIRIEGAELRSRRFSGVFDADYPEALLKYLASDLSIIVDRTGDDVVIRARPASPESTPKQPATN